MHIYRTGVSESVIGDPRRSVSHDAGAAVSELARAGPIVLFSPGCERFTTTVPARPHRVVVSHFANGELYVRLPVHVRERACTVITSISPPAGNVERLTMISHTLRRAGARSITAVLPYLAYARQDIAPPTESLGLKWLGELLGGAGVSSLITVDVHSHEASSLLGIPVRSLSPASLMSRALGGRWRESVTFVAPDEGARERCQAVARAAGSDRPIVWARKRRTAGGVEHLGLEGSPGRRAIIVDDILDTGGTLISCCEQLRAAGVEEVGVLITHGLFTGDSWRSLVGEMVDELWITDTVMARRRPPGVNVISIAPLLSEVLTHTSD